jgi:putative flippase GtrA
MSAQLAVLRIPASFWRFGLVGAFGLAVDMAALYAAIWGLGLTALPAKGLSFLAAATFTWRMNRQYTFERSGKSLGHEWAGFLAANALGGAVNFAVYTAILARLPPEAWTPALATAAGSLGGLLFNYTASRHIVFAKPRPCDGGAREAAPPLPAAAYPLTLLACLGSGAAALWLGMDANWDLRNYHWYNGWAFLNGLLGRDLLVSQTPSFYNPTLDAAYVWLAGNLPARAVGFALGMAHGLNFLPLFAIAWRLSDLAHPGHRLALSASAALAGITGAGGVSELGTVFYDNLLSLCVSGSAWLVVWRWDTLTGENGLSDAGWALLAGLPAGLAFGLKQPMVIFCVGLCAAFLAADLPWPRRLRLGFSFGFGVLLGFAIGGGHWAWHLWTHYGNPLFPYFNHIFQSPWGLPAPYRDETFVPRTWAEKLLLAYRFSFNTRLVGEAEFRDFRILALVTLVPLAAANRWRKPGPPSPAGWLLAAGLLGYAAWVILFSIYRYLIPLEMLAPAMIVAAVGWLPVPGKAQALAAACALWLLVSCTIPGNWLRVPWEAQAIPVEVPPVERPEQTLVLLSGREPLSFLIPAFPKSLRFYRIDSNFALPGDPGSGFRKQFHDAIRGHLGPLASLHLAAERDMAAAALAGYGLELDGPGCRPVSSPLNPAPYALCPVRRLAAPP